MFETGEELDPLLRSGDDFCGAAAGEFFFAIIDRTFDGRVVTVGGTRLGAGSIFSGRSVFSGGGSSETEIVSWRVVSSAGRIG